MHSGSNIARRLPACRLVSPRSERAIARLLASLTFLSVILLAQSLSAAGMREQIPPREYDALTSFYATTNGREWFYDAGWLDPAAEYWYGIRVEGVVVGPDGHVITQGHVTQIVLEANDLDGPIPPALLDLADHLKILDLWGNRLKGPVPPFLGELTLLSYLSLGANYNLNGLIPRELGNLTNLRFLNLEYTDLNGAIPVELANLALLEIFYARFSHLTGGLPVELARLHRLQQCDLYHNWLTGSIPPEFGALAELLYLNLGRNKLTGSIPPELGNLSQLLVLGLSHNQLTGSIPVSLGQLGYLQELYLEGNYLSGEIPPVLGNLTNLSLLSLDGNGLTGPIPGELGNLSRLIGLELSKNQLTGDVPQNLGRLGAVQFISLGRNNLSDSVPAHFASTRLFSLDLSRNGFDLTPGSKFEEAVAALRAQGIGVADFPQNGPNPLLNVSGRARVGLGDNVLITGFTLRGTEYNGVLLRGLGPSLSRHGVNGEVLPDPFLGLYGINGGITENDDWNYLVQRLADPKYEPEDDRESYIQETLDPGVYTAVLRGRDGAQGIGLVENYSYGYLDAELVNLSARGFVGRGDELFIGGFVIGPLGPGSTTIVVRAMGPSLVPAGVANALVDPTLELRDQNGGLLAFNDNWRNGQPSELEEVHLAPQDDRESAFVVELRPGSYTALLRGTGDATGIGLLELYNVGSIGPSNPEALGMASKSSLR
jgi:Leucine-rich repeat (LRR) protein